MRVLRLLAVSLAGGLGHVPLLANAHVEQTFVPAVRNLLVCVFVSNVLREVDLPLDDLAGADLEVERLAAIVACRRVKRLAQTKVQQVANIRKG